MARPKITLYVDIVSPFAYLGYYMLRVGFLLYSMLPPIQAYAGLNCELPHKIRNASVVEEL